MEIRGIDPRDQEWEIPNPKYRVYFFDSMGGSDEYEVEGADVPEVLNWAENECGGRTFVLYVCVPAEASGLIRLSGQDPNDR